MTVDIFEVGQGVDMKKYINALHIQTCNFNTCRVGEWESEMEEELGKADHKSDRKLRLTM